MHVEQRTQKNVSQFHSCVHHSAQHIAEIKYNGYTYFPKHKQYSCGAALAPCWVADALHAAVAVRLPFVWFHSRLFKLACRWSLARN